MADLKLTSMKNAELQNNEEIPNPPMDKPKSQFDAYIERLNKILETIIIISPNNI